MDEEKTQKDALESDIKAYKKLDKINQSPEFDTFFNLQVDTVAQKMLSCFTGSGPKDWNEFCRIRGEVIGILYPIQQIRGSKVLVKQLTEQLNAYYNEKIDI